MLLRCAASWAVVKMVTRPPVACAYGRYDVHYPRGVFNSACDACFVIACCGADFAREGEMRMQLDRLKPFSTVSVWIFAGYAKCQGSASVAHDLMRNYLQIFELAAERRYKRILILEDDFEIEEELCEEDTTSIANFISKSDPEMYGLGNWMMTPTPETMLLKHQKAVASIMLVSQACFYSARYMSRVLSFFQGHIGGIPPATFASVDWWPWYFQASSYRFHRPLVMQKFPATENQVKGWKSNTPVVFNFPFAVDTAVRFLRLLGLHQKVQPGWSIIYALTSYSVFVILLVTSLLVALALARPRDGA